MWKKNSEKKRFFFQISILIIVLQAIYTDHSILDAYWSQFWDILSLMNAYLINQLNQSLLNF